MTTQCAMCQQPFQENDLVYSEHGQICTSCELDLEPPMPIWRHPPILVGGIAILTGTVLTINLNGFQPVPLVTGAVAAGAGAVALISKNELLDKNQRMALGALILVIGLYRLATGVMSLM